MQTVLRKYLKKIVVLNLSHSDLNEDEEGSNLKKEKEKKNTNTMTIINTQPRTYVDILASVVVSFASREENTNNSKIMSVTC